MVIDFHTHNFPASLAPRAVAVMVSKLNRCFLPVGDGLVSTQLHDMDRAGVTHCVNCPVAVRPHDFEPIFRRACALRAGEESAEMAARSVQLASIHPCDPDFRTHIRLLQREGFKGIKIHPNYMGVRLDDQNLIPFFEELAEAGLFVISHCGYDPGYGDDPEGVGPDQVKKLLTAVPQLTFIAAHLGGECGNRSHATDQLLVCENCLIDTAVAFHHDKDPEAQRVCRTWPASRMVFGTDYFWRNEADVMRWVKMLRPDAHDQELIFHQNAERLLGLV